MLMFIWEWNKSWQLAEIIVTVEVGRAGKLKEAWVIAREKTLLTELLQKKSIDF